MMVASINNETNEVKVVSIFRDTLLKQQDGTFDKANAHIRMEGRRRRLHF